jgi:histidyl-tRNA synthetase
MHDTMPDQVSRWQYIEKVSREILDAYGYQEIRVPLLEKTELFKRSIGEVTDIVEKEMYTFEDRNGDSLTLRPEGTASCVRAASEHGLLRNQVQRLWYNGPMFRHERPQKGRYRQFHQIGVEAFGLPGPDIDAEHIAMTARLWQRLGLDELKLQLNSLGSAEARRAYKALLVDYFYASRDQLDEDSLRRLDSNPLRILDSKNPDMQSLITAAPVMTEHLDDESKAHFDQLLAYLDSAGIGYDINPRLVRGLDYYCRTVFEWVSANLGAQGTVCAGGRFDNLVEHLGGEPTPAAGYAIGLERLVVLLEAAGNPPQDDVPHAYLIMVGEHASTQGFRIAEQLRNAVPQLRLVMNCGGGSFKSQFKRADKSGALVSLVLGEDEIKHSKISIKPLREEGEQVLLDMEQAAQYLQRLVS